MAVRNESFRRVIRIRRSAEQNALRAFGDIERHQNQATEFLRRLNLRLEEQRCSLRDRLTGELDMSSLRLHSASSLNVMSEARRTVHVLAALQQRLDVLHDDVVKSIQKRKGLEWLSAQRSRERRRLRDQRANLDLDDQGMSRHARTKECAR